MGGAYHEREKSGDRVNPKKSREIIRLTMADVNPDVALGDYDRGRLASRVLKKNFYNLSRALTEGAIPSKLYEKDLISEELLDVILSPLPKAKTESTTDSKAEPKPSRSGVNVGARAVRELQEKVQANPDGFDILCTILLDNKWGKLSSSLKGMSFY